MTSLSTGTTALPIAGDAPSVCLEDQRLDDGYVQPLLFHQSDLAKKTASLQMLLAESSSSSDDEDSIYEEISTGALKHISHGMLKSYSKIEYTILLIIVTIYVRVEMEEFLKKGFRKEKTRRG